MTIEFVTDGKRLPSCLAGRKAEMSIHDLELKEEAVDARMRGHDDPG